MEKECEMYSFDNKIKKMEQMLEIKENKNLIT